MNAFTGIQHRARLGSLLLSAAVLLPACSSGSNDRNDEASVMEDEKNNYSYNITLKNLSYNQPLSPAAVIVDSQPTDYWRLGEPASEALEMLAESGDNSALLATVDDQALYDEAGRDLVHPAASESWSFDFEAEEINAYLSLVSMLVNSNDAYTGIQQVDLSTLAVNDEITLALMTYDSGTEANGELQGTIPGPADGGEGFNTMRNDVDYVAMHPGVVANVAEHPDSVLDQSHRFDAPIAELVIQRMQ